MHGLIRVPAGFKLSCLRKDSIIVCSYSSPENTIRDSIFIKTFQYSTAIPYHDDDLVIQLAGEHSITLLTTHVMTLIGVQLASKHSIFSFNWHQNIPYNFHSVRIKTLAANISMMMNEFEQFHFCYVHRIAQIS